jgi:hypothetical protein
VRINDGRHGVRGIVKAVDELKPKRNDEKEVRKFRGKPNRGQVDKKLASGIGHAAGHSGRKKQDNPSGLAYMPYGSVRARLSWNSSPLRRKKVAGSSVGSDCYRIINFCFLCVTSRREPTPCNSGPMISYQQKF